jgi:5'(3')-deoxyribonucleotidase
MRKALSWDLDGVIVGGEYCPRWDRTPEYYLRQPILDPYSIEVINRLARKADIYFLSGRAFHNATNESMCWLQEKGIEWEWISGIVTSLSPTNKARAVNLLGIELHFDDDPRVCEAIGRQHSLLVDGPSWPSNQLSSHPRVRGWREIEAAAWEVVNGPRQTALFHGSCPYTSSALGDPR